MKIQFHALRNHAGPLSDNLSFVSGKLRGVRLPCQLFAKNSFPRLMSNINCRLLPPLALSFLLSTFFFLPHLYCAPTLKPVRSPNDTRLYNSKCNKKKMQKNKKQNNNNIIKNNDTTLKTQFKFRRHRDTEDTRRHRVSFWT